MAKGESDFSRPAGFLRAGFCFSQNSIRFSHPSWSGIAVEDGIASLACVPAIHVLL